MRKLTALGSDATLSHADDEITKSSSRRIKRIQRERGVKRQSKIERNHHTGERERDMYTRLWRCEAPKIL